MEKQYDLVIIGSGPAGLAAAIYAQRARLNTLVIEKEMMSGGQVLSTYEVDNYPGLPGINGFDLGMKLRQHADQLEAVFCEDEVEAVELVKAEEQGEEQLQAAELHEASDSMMSAQEAGKTENSAVMKKIIGKKDTYYGKTVIIASGAMHSKLGVPGEEEFGGMGVSYCATCDGAFFRKKVTAVVGGGDVAIEDAIFLARMCEKVYLIHRRDQLRGASVFREKLFALDNVTVLWDTVVEEIRGEGKVNSLAVKNVKRRSVGVILGHIMADLLRNDCRRGTSPVAFDVLPLAVLGEFDFSGLVPGSRPCNPCRKAPRPPSRRRLRRLRRRERKLRAGLRLRESS